MVCLLENDLMHEIKYLDDNAWQNFAQLFERQWLKFEHKENILNLVNGDTLLAMVVSQVSAKPETWLETKIPALNGKTPIWCLKNYKDKQLKAILMNMPW
jgi:hypothetical protein